MAFARWNPLRYAGRRGALIRSSAQGRRGRIKTFWSSGQTELDVFASSMEAYFDFDTPDGEAPDPEDNEATPVITVFDDALRRADILRRCFRFRFERTWADYYAWAALSPLQMDAIARHALGTIAIDIPVLLSFLGAPDDPSRHTTAALDAGATQ